MKTLANRIKKRNRPGEQFCTESYQRSLETNYIDYLNDCKESGVKVHKLENNLSLKDAVSKVSAILSENYIEISV